ncbi:MAG: hypothetical protein ACLPV8_08860 [Steroidobacteraceae bacterium]
MLEATQIESFNSRGFCVIDRVVPAQALAELRAAADALVESTVKVEPYPPP